MSEVRKPVVLITSAGSLVTAAILRCLEPVRNALTVVGVNSVTHAPIAFLCDRLYLVPPASDAVAYGAALRDVAALESPSLVLAGRDEDVAILASVAAAGWLPTAVYPGPPPALAPVFTDKLRTWRFAVAHGLPFAQTAAGLEQALALALNSGYPLIAKPRAGAGSRDVEVLVTRTELERAAADPRLMIQAFLAPDDIAGQWEAFRHTAAAGMPWHWSFTDIETTAELVIDSAGTISGLCLDSGVTAPPLRTDVSLLADREVAAVGMAWAETLAAQGHRGPVNIQGKRLPDGSFIPYEIGARFGGTSISRARLGGNLVLQLVEDVLGLQRSGLQSGLARRTVGLEMRRLAVPVRWLDELAASGRWQVPPAGALRPDFIPLPETGAQGDGGPEKIWEDRQALAVWARAGGLPFVATVETVEGVAELVREAGFPLVAKPRFGKGTVHLLGSWSDVEAAFDFGPVVVQACLGPASLAASRAQWRDLASAPWQWAVADSVEIVEGMVSDGQSEQAARVARCSTRGGVPFDVRPASIVGVERIFARWSERLAHAGYRGGFRLTGKRDRQGRWVPFSAKPTLLGLPEPEMVELRIRIPV